MSGYGMKKKTMVMVLLTALCTALFAQTTGQNVVKPVIANQDLVIPIKELNENAIFYPVAIEVTRLEVLAVKVLDGTIRTTFNTCQVCYASGRGFYKQQGSMLVCQNCGNRFRMSQVGIRFRWL